MRPLASARLDHLRRLGRKGKLSRPNTPRPINTRRSCLSRAVALSSPATCQIDPQIVIDRRWVAWDVHHTTARFCLHMNENRQHSVVLTSQSRKFGCFCDNTASQSDCASISQYPGRRSPRALRPSSCEPPRVPAPGNHMAQIDP